MTPRPPRAHATPDPEEVRPRIRERVYITFTGLAVLLAFGAHAENADGWTIASALLIGVVGAVLAGFFADVIAGLAVGGRAPRARAMAGYIGVSTSALSTAVVPLAFLAAAGFGWIDVATALVFAIGTMALGLAVIAFAAVARAELPWWAKLAVFVGELLFAAVVIVVKLLAHG
ncbi:hypothetical protein ACEXQE_07065 [Herbiconiux sp. P17]|uniref:hypothetical protein n=1 Tax=Herbiconiux wuyangfengii TaxID=3342794 RepID=UPI0035BB27EC